MGMHEKACRSSVVPAISVLVLHFWHLTGCSMFYLGIPYTGYNKNGDTSISLSVLQLQAPSTVPTWYIRHVDEMDKKRLLFCPVLYVPPTQPNPTHMCVLYM